MAKFVHPRVFMEKLAEMGIADDTTQRVIIDFSLTDMPRIFIERIGDASLLEIVPVIANNANGIKAVEKEKKNG